MLIGNWWGRVLNDCMDFSSDEENFLNEVILHVESKPHVNELLWQWLDEL